MATDLWPWSNTASRLVEASIGPDVLDDLGGSPGDYGVARRGGATAGASDVAAAGVAEAGAAPIPRRRTSTNVGARSRLRRRTAFACLMGRPSPR